jgi:hypothetical protein
MIKELVLKRLKEYAVENKIEFDENETKYYSILKGQAKKKIKRISYVK